jgi:membrane-bound lytic murein transglycosylase B
VIFFKQQPSYYLVVQFLILCSPCFATAAGDSELARCIQQARRQGLDSAFLHRVSEAPGASFQEKAVRINYNDASVAKVKAFVAENKKMLQAAQDKYNVPAEVIAAILWVESKCGRVTGKYHVASVYLSILLASEPDYIQQSLDLVMHNNHYDESERDSLRSIVEKRALKKSTWALGELRAMQEIEKRKVMNVTSLHGSWAGAFGFPQFLPSSYHRWAVDGDADGTIDLYNMADAAHSIGNYLKVNGWGKKQAQKVAAVHHYNNSDAYVNCVLRLAKKVTDEPLSKKTKRKSSRKKSRRR